MNSVFPKIKKNLLVLQFWLYQIHQELTDLGKALKVNKVIKLIRINLFYNFTQKIWVKDVKSELFIIDIICHLQKILILDFAIS